MDDRSKLPPSLIEDAELREMFLLAGVRVENEADVKAFAKLVRWLFLREESFMKRKARQGKMFGAIGVAVLTVVVGWLASIVQPFLPWIVK